MKNKNGQNAEETNENGKSFGEHKSRWNAKQCGPVVDLLEVESLWSQNRMLPVAVASAVAD